MMLKMRLSIVLLLASTSTPAVAETPAISAVADIIDLTGKPIGRAQFRQGPHGVLIDIEASDLVPGPHGVHFHATGQCDVGTKFATAAGHMGHDSKPHGLLNSKDHHAGDLPNIIAHDDGNASAQFYTSDVRISGKANKRQMMLLDADGSSLIIHEKADDGFSQPLGGAGSRVACGTIKRP
jgi:superoxide dismutase, Cu-Zn family